MRMPENREDQPSKEALREHLNDCRNAWESGRGSLETNSDLSVYSSFQQSVKICFMMKNIDLGLDPEALGDGKYSKLVNALMEHSYAQDENRRNFQLVRSVPSTDGGTPIAVAKNDQTVRFLLNVPVKPSNVDGGQ